MEKLLNLLNVKINKDDEFKDANNKDRLEVYLVSRSEYFNSMKKSY